MQSISSHLFLPESPGLLSQLVGHPITSFLKEHHAPISRSSVFGALVTWLALLAMSVFLFLLILLYLCLCDDPVIQLRLLDDTLYAPQRQYAHVHQCVHVMPVTFILKLEVWSMLTRFKQSKIFQKLIRLTVHRHRQQGRQGAMLSPSEPALDLSGSQQLVLFHLMSTRSRIN